VSITTFIVALLTAVAIGQSLLATLILGSRTQKAAAYLPLALFFLTNAVLDITTLAILPIFFEEIPLLAGLMGFTVIPLYCALAPLFWIYVRGITSEHSVIWSSRDVWHFMLTIIALAVPITAWLMPSHEFLALFSPSDNDIQRNLVQTALAISITALDILIILQVVFYVILVIRRLAEYRRKLTQLFSSTEHLELRWFRWLALFLFAYVVLTVANMAAEALFRSPHSLDLWEKLVDVGLITTLAIWGLRQKPGLSIESEAIIADNKGSRKYQHSALNSEQCKALAIKIEHAMSNDKLFQRDELSLRLLAKHINELPSYVTQTLNTEIGESFFDYVNRWRIEEASRRLASSDDTVLDIATGVGFNSRSSFYNAFKKITGVTPSAYRKKVI